MRIQVEKQPLEFILYTGFRSWTIYVTPTEWKFGFEAMPDESKWVWIGPVTAAGYVKDLSR